MARTESQSSLHRRLRLGVQLTALVLCAMPILRADVVYLKNGRQIEGSVNHDEDNGRVSIRSSSGIVVELAEDDIARDPDTGKLRIVKRKLPEDIFEERLERAPADSLDALFELAVWAREQRLRSQLRRVCGKILEIDPNNEMARKELGYTVFENAWVLESELRKNRKEKGLVKFRGEWMQAEERDRRLREEARREIADLVESAASRNRYVQEFAVRKLMAYRGEHGRSIFAGYLADPRETVRIVAASALTNFRSRHRDPRMDPEARRITGELYRLLMRAETSAELKALYLTLRLFQPAESFRLGLQTLQTSASERERQRAAEVAYQTLKKAWVPTLCRALVVSRDGEEVRKPAVREVLKRALKVDFGFEVGRWLAWWEAHEHRFRDEP